MKRILVTLALISFIATGFAVISGCGVAPTVANAVIIGGGVSTMEKSKTDKDDNDSTKGKRYDPASRRWIKK